MCEANESFTELKLRGHSLVSMEFDLGNADDYIEGDFDKVLAGKIGDRNLTMSVTILTNRN